MFWQCLILCFIIIINFYNMRRKISFTNLEDIKSFLSPISKEELSSYVGGGNGTYNSPYTMEEYQNYGFSKCWVKVDSNTTVYFSDSYSSVCGYDNSDSFGGGSTNYANSFYFGDTCYGGTTNTMQYTYVKISTNRYDYGDNSTISQYTAWAYSQDGDVIDSISGYFLEPETDYGRSNQAGSDTAIPSGTYEIHPYSSAKHPNSFQIDGISGRDKVLIHTGNTGGDTEGCFLPGTNEGTPEKDGSPTVVGSKAEYKELKDFINKYGNGHASINVSM